MAQEQKDGRTTTLTMVTTAGPEGGKPIVVEISVADFQKSTGILPPQVALEALSSMNV